MLISGTPEPADGDTPLGDSWLRQRQAIEDAVHLRSEDQVARMHRVMRANAGLMITIPRANGTGHFKADWTSEDEVRGTAHHWDLRVLLDELTSTYGFTE